MDKVSVVAYLEDSYPGCPIEMRPADNPTEIVCTLSADEQCVTEVAAIERSEWRCHEGTFTVYSVVEGDIVLHIEDQTKTLNQGSAGVVYPGEVYWAESTDSVPAIALVISIQRSGGPLRTVFHNRFLESVQLIRHHLQALADKFATIAGDSCLPDDDLQDCDRSSEILTRAIALLPDDATEAFSPIEAVFVPTGQGAEMERVAVIAVHQLHAQFTQVRAALDEVDGIGLIDFLRAPGQALERVAPSFDQAIAKVHCVLSLLSGVGRAFYGLGINTEAEASVATA